MRDDLPTIRAVARRAGVSLATVSNVLSGRRMVAPELAARVEAAAADLGYVADVAASQLRSRRRTVVGVLVPDLANPFFAAIVAGIETLARRDGYDLIVAGSSEDPAQEAARLRTLIAWRPAGVVVIPCDDAFAARTIAMRRQVPVVVVDRRPSNSDCDVVDADNRSAARSAAEHLIGLGHASILAVATRLAISNIRDRVEGIRAAVACSGRSIALDVVEVGHDLEAIRDDLVGRLAPAVRPQALFTLTNTITLGALGALLRCGLAVPRDVSLIGFDDYEWMRVASPPITTVRQPAAAMSRAAWERLTARLLDPALEPRHIEIPCTLEIRSSTGPAAGRRGVPQRELRLVCPNQQGRKA